MNDEMIVELLFKRSEQGITELAKKYGRIHIKIAENILGNGSDAEECVNDAYLGVWNAIPPERPKLLNAYVCRIIRNISLKKYHANTAVKRNSRYDTAFQELEECLSTGETAETAVEARELSKMLDKFLDGLDKQNRVIFVLRYWYSESVTDIAEKLDLSAGSVSARLCRIRKKLYKFLVKEGVYE